MVFEGQRLPSPGRELTRSEAHSLPVGTKLLYRDRPEPGLRLATVKEYQQIGSTKILIVQLDDGTKRSPVASSLYWIEGCDPPHRSSGSAAA